MVTIGTSKNPNVFASYPVCVGSIPPMGRSPSHAIHSGPEQLIFAALTTEIEAGKHLKRKHVSSKAGWS